MTAVDLLVMTSVANFARRSSADRITLDLSGLVGPLDGLYNDDGRMRPVSTPAAKSSRPGPTGRSSPGSDTQHSVYQEISAQQTVGTREGLIDLFVEEIEAALRYRGLPAHRFPAKGYEIT